MFRISYSRACQVFICVLPVLFQKASPLQLAFWKDRAGSGAHPQPGLPWRREGEPRGGGPLSPHLLSPASRGSPGEDRTSHAAGQTEAALSPSPQHGSPPRTSHAGGGRPPSPRPAPLRPLSPPCSPRRQERAGAWRRAPSRENTAASVSSSPSRKADSRTQREYPESPKFDTELHHPSRVIYLIF